jgi:hypothetical protein
LNTKPKAKDLIKQKSISKSNSHEEDQKEEPEDDDHELESKNDDSDNNEKVATENDESESDKGHEDKSKIEKGGFR